MVDIGEDEDDHEQFFDDGEDEDFPDDAQPIHLFPDEGVDPRFARLSAEQLEDEDWQPASDDAHKEGITRHVRESQAAMRVPGARRARRGSPLSPWAGGPMDGLGGDEPRHPGQPRGPGGGRGRNKGTGGGNGPGKRGGKSRPGKAAGARKGAAPKPGQRKAGGARGAQNPGNTAPAGRSKPAGARKGGPRRRRSNGPRKSDSRVSVDNADGLFLLGSHAIIVDCARR
ncbi:MAG: hypothetical protein R3E68_07040 [Burkholderiaceae bacterium]